MNFSLESLRQQLQSLPPANRYIIGFSGGLDSAVLLHALSRLALPQPIIAIHINHQLQSAAAAWVGHCQRLCQSWQIPLEIIAVDAVAAKGISPEAAARTARYQAWHDYLQPGDILLTAQHQDDQAETVLLQLLRGSGPAGLAAMPFVKEFAAGWQARPLLQYPRKALLSYAQQQQLHWIEDNSNTDTRFTRNYLRQQIIPLLQRRWPGLSRTLSRVALHQAELQTTLAEIGAADQSAIQGSQLHTLSINALLKLTPTRRSNAIRYWLNQQALPLPTASQMQQLQGILALPEDRNPELRWANIVLRRYQDDLYFLFDFQYIKNTISPILWDIRQPLSLPELGIKLNMQALKAAGLVLPENITFLQVRLRQGGERIKLPGRTHSHSLKKVLQQRKVPPWLRGRLPLLYYQEQLVAVVGLEPIIIGEGL